MKVIFDTNVVLDCLLKRKPFHEISAWLMNRVEGGLLDGSLCANSITTIEYLIAKNVGRSTAKRAIKHLLAVFEIAEVNKAILDSAIVSPLADFEDTVIYQSGLGVGVDAVVTRDAKGFKKSEIPVYSPEDLYALILEVNENEKENARTD
ncbi:MAG: PIN domain-containing protein [Candidatus Omnitrophica bacterium]|nr:PIN domain-containing protein [Candidatus Omnitrophota bacterium]MCA9429009.1 PIN domain-containing protein [Candidatus Omnitrophota bacterium]